MNDTTSTEKAPTAAHRYQIFEQAALERLRNGSDQSKPVGFLPLPVRLMATAAIGITGLGVLWSVLAQVPVQVNGIGTIVPEGTISSAVATIGGTLYYQVSGMGPDRLSAQQRSRNQALAQFWQTSVVGTKSTLPHTTLQSLAFAASEAYGGERLVMPEATDQAEAFDQADSGGRVFSALFYPANTLIAQINNPAAVEELDSVRRTIRSRMLLAQNTVEDRRDRARAYRGFDPLIRMEADQKRRELVDREALLMRLRTLWAQGYVSTAQLLQEQSAVNGLRQQLLQLERDRIGNTFNTADQSQQADQADLSALQGRNELQSALVNYISKAYIIAPANGLYVVARYLSNQMLVHPGDELFTYSFKPPALPARIPVFVDATTVHQLREGMAVLVTPKGISRAQYGGIPGTVDEVGRLPLAGEGLAAVAGGRSLAASVAQAISTPYLVRVTLKQAHPAFCQQLLSSRCYAWSTSKVPPFPVRLGAQADVQITTIHRRPIDFVMPALHQALGLVVENR